MKVQTHLPRRKFLRRGLIGAACVVAALAVSLLVAGLTGAIFTTNSAGGLVNGNIYPNKCDVYLNGGPGSNAPSSAAGLPDGQYYYQVTDPSGQTLLAGPGSTPDTGGKLITVVGGAFTTLIQLCPFNTTPNPGGEYKVWVTAIADFAPSQEFHGFIPSKTKTDNFKVKKDDGGPKDVHPLLTVKKFYDANVNGAQDTGELLLSGWLVNVTDPLSLVNSYFTPTSTPITTPGQYTVSEVMPLGSWVHTALKVDGSYSNSGLPSQPPKNAVFQLVAENHDVLFGNVCLGPGGGKTLGFWSNKNGETTMSNMPGGMSAALANLSSLNLKDALGNNFDPTSYTQFRNWLLAANSTNMAYMLSAQLAAMSLNVQAGPVSGTAVVWTVSGFTTISALIASANSELGLHPYTPAGDPIRSYQESLKNTLDQANNNLNFVQSQPCQIRYP